MPFLALASFVFAMLSSGRIANFVMRSNNSMDVCPNTWKLSRRLFIVADRNGARELRVSSRAAFRSGIGPPCSLLSAFRLPLFFHSPRSARTSVDRLPRKCVFFGPSKPNARESFAFPREGAESSGLTAPTYPCATSAPARAPLLPPECRRIFGALPVCEKIDARLTIE
jgi:hypothetical protein